MVIGVDSIPQLFDSKPKRDISGKWGILREKQIQNLKGFY
jgi:hypothetical protein